MGIPFQSTFDVSYIATSSIFEEIKHIKKNINAVETLILSQRVCIKDPSSETLSNLKQSISSFDSSRLSEADLSIIALGMEMKVPIVTSDYALANLARRLNLKVIIPGKEKFKIKTMKPYCSLCKSFDNALEPYCSKCGNLLIFKKQRENHF